MKNFFLICLAALSFVAFGCSKEVPRPVADDGSVELRHQKTLYSIDSACKIHGDGLEQSLIISENEFLEICQVEDMYLDVWTDDQLRHVLPVEAENFLTYDERLRFLRQYIPSDRLNAAEGSTTETFIVRSTGPARFDANIDIVAQVMAASGTTVGRFSSLNLWRPTIPFDSGIVTSFDITRAISGVNQSGTFDYFAEYVPESVEWGIPFSGGNWTIAVDLVFYNPAMQPDTIHFEELFWNPTWDSPGNDDVIQGPMPFNILAISANGLVPPNPA